MKTITGSVICSNPISLSNAAKIISNFAATENGASQAIGAYIRRASVSFNEVKQIHREILKPSKSERKHKSRKSESTAIGVSKPTIEDGEKRKRKSEEIEDGKGSNSSELYTKKKKKKRKGE